MVVLDTEVSVGPATTAAVVGAPLTDITMSTKAMSVVSVTSQCSYSSTIVHVPRPESGIYRNPFICVSDHERLSDSLAQIEFASHILTNCRWKGNQYFKRLSDKWDFSYVFVHRGHSTGGRPYGQ